MDLDSYHTLKSIAFTKPHRSRKFLNKVKALPCIKCGIEPAGDPHHIFGSMGSLKCDDRFCVPLCREHHIWYDKHRDAKTREELILPWIIKTVLPILEEI